MIFQSIIRRAGRRFLPLGLTFLLAASAFGQGLRLPAGEITLSELFRRIEQQTGLTVIYNAELLDPARRVSAPGGETALSDMLNRTGYQWQINDRYVVIRTPEKPRPVAVPQQPSRAGFERNVASYTQQNIPAGTRVVVRTDTLRTVRPPAGSFHYPARQYLPGREVEAPLRPIDPRKFALKTNLVWGAAGLAPNIAGEIGLGGRTSLEFSAGINRWNLEGSPEDNQKTAHWILKPEFRYWLCERFNGHFFGVHAIYADYNVGGHDIPTLFEKEYRYRGQAYGGGISYGYLWPLSKRFGVEFTAGAGVLRLDYERSDCTWCARGGEETGKTWLGPTSLGVKVVWMID